MQVNIARGDLGGSHGLVTDAVRRYLNPAADGRRFGWLYRENPFGEARLWVAADAATGRMVGAAAAFPRRMYADGGEVLGWVLGDFWMREEYRSLGPAVELQRACLREVDLGAMTFCYDFPSANMMAVYRRLGVTPSHRMVRMVKPIRVDRRVAEWVRVPIVARGLSAVGNLALTLRDPVGPRDGSLSVAVYDGVCGEEFSVLAREVGGRYGLCVCRSADYLNWRYLENPMGRHELVTARRGGTLVGYAVFTQSGQDGSLVDLFGLDEDAIVPVLIGGVAALLRSRGVVTLSVWLIETHPWVGRLRRLGFVPRETSPVVLYHPNSQSGRGLTTDGLAWFLVQGDRDS